MKKLTHFFAFILAIIPSEQRANANDVAKLIFSPEKGIHAEITGKGQQVLVTLKVGLIATTDKIFVETERPLALAIEDYNFDGRKDFSISHIDDGMGSYTVYQIYLYIPSKRTFAPMEPKCGDQFINIRVSKKHRKLTNSYFSDNVLKTCDEKY